MPKVPRVRSFHLSVQEHPPIRVAAFKDTAAREPSRTGEAQGRREALGGGSRRVQEPVGRRFFVFVLWKLTGYEQEGHCQ